MFRKMSRTFRAVHEDVEIFTASAPREYRTAVGTSEEDPHQLSAAATAPAPLPSTMMMTADPTLLDTPTPEINIETQPSLPHLPAAAAVDEQEEMQKAEDEAEFLLPPAEKLASPSLPETLPDTEMVPTQEIEEDRVYSSDEDEDYMGAEEEVVEVEKLSPPPPPITIHHHHHHFGVNDTAAAATTTTEKRMASAPFIRPHTTKMVNFTTTAITTATSIIGVKRSPHRALSKQPLKLMKGINAFKAPRKIELPHTLQPPMLLETKNTTTTPLPSLPPTTAVDAGAPLANTNNNNKKPVACLDDAVTAAQMVAQHLGDGAAVEKPNTYSLRPLPLPIDFPAAAAAGVDAFAINSPGSSEVPSLGMLCSAKSHGGLTQMGESEDLYGHALLPPTLVDALGVRKAQDLLLLPLNKNSGGGGGDIATAVDVQVPAESTLVQQEQPQQKVCTAAIGLSRFAPLSLPLPQILPVETTAPAAPGLFTTTNYSPPSPAAVAAAAPIKPTNPIRTTPPPPPPLDNYNAIPIPLGSAPGFCMTPASATRPPSSNNRPIPTAPAGCCSPNETTTTTTAAPTPPLHLGAYLGEDILRAMFPQGSPLPALYPWQAECLMVDNAAVLLREKNLVFTAPTSAGKTRIAQILMLRSLVMAPGKKAMLVLPYKTLCREMAKELTPLVKALGLEVKQGHGDHYSGDPLGPTTGIYVCTIENAISTINQLLSQMTDSAMPLRHWFSCIVVDELHLLRDTSRGAHLELLLTKLMYDEKKYEAKVAADALVLLQQQKHQQQQQQQQLASAQTPIQKRSIGGGGGGGAPAPGYTGYKNTATTANTSTGITPLRTRTPGTSTTTATTNTNTSDGHPAFNKKPIQIIGMSATLPNINSIAKWLKAAVYISRFRPVPLYKYLKAGNELLALPEGAVKDGGGGGNRLALVKVRDLPVAEAHDTDHIAFLTEETVQQGHSVLVFCGYKKSCEIEAKKLAKCLKKIPDKSVVAAAAAPPDGDGATTQLTVVDVEDDGYMDLGEFAFTREAVAKELETLPHQHSKTLASLVRQGIAYHHSELMPVERPLIEGAFCSGAISVLCATSTLAAGVNLPARRVIFRHPYLGLPDMPLDSTKYRQMAGRAGRAGIDDVGEAILVWAPSVKVSRPYLEELMWSRAEEVDSSLNKNGRLIYFLYKLIRISSHIFIHSFIHDTDEHMQRGLLEMVACNRANTGAEVLMYTGSLLSASLCGDDGQQAKALCNVVKAALGELTQKGEFIVWDGVRKMYSSTPKGNAVVVSGMGLPDACRFLVRFFCVCVCVKISLKTDVKLIFIIFVCRMC